MTVTTERPNGPAPAALAGNKGNKGGRVAQAWQYVWDNLDREQWTGGQDIAARAAARYGLKATSVLTHIIRMAGEGHIEVDYKKAPRPVHRTVTLKDGTKRDTTYMANHECSFYRIAK